MAAITHGSNRVHQVLDPRTIGRPVHLLDKFTERFARTLTELFQQHFNRRYRAQFEIVSVTFDPLASIDSLRWQTFGSSVGRVACAIDRSVLLSLLAYRYGVAASPLGSFDAHEAARTPETATEERLAAKFAQQLASAAADLVEALQPEAGTQPQAIELTPIARTSLDGAWTLRARIAERNQTLEGSLWLRMDEAWIARLLRALAPARDKTARASVASAQPLPARLQLKLTARLLEKSVPLGTVLDLRVDDVIPITLGTTSVLIDDSCLFTASVAEHKGKLCLTSFEAVE